LREEVLAKADLGQTELHESHRESTTAGDGECSPRLFAELEVVQAQHCVLLGRSEQVLYMPDSLRALSAFGRLLLPHARL
jgi:hypothetical protein